MKSFSISPGVLALVICLYISAACSTAKMPASDLEKIRNQSPPEGRALVYVVRPTSFGYAAVQNITCDNKDIGSTTGQRFIYVYLDSGLHKFSVKAENRPELFLQVVPGKTYFIEEKIKLGLMAARSELERLEDAAGRSKLRLCKLSGDCPAYVAAR